MPCDAGPSYSETLKEDLDKVTAYAAALNTNATAPGVARRFLDFLDGAAARELLTAAGME